MATWRLRAIRLSGLHRRPAARRRGTGADARVPERGFVPDLAAIPAEALERARLMFINYPNNPTGAVAPVGFFEEVVAFAREHDLLVVHDSASELTFDGYVAPSFLATPGAIEVGVEVFSLSKSYNMTGWGVWRRSSATRTRSPVLAAQDQHRLRALRSDPARRRGRADRAAGHRARHVRALRPPAGPLIEAWPDRIGSTPGARSASGRRCRSIRLGVVAEEVLERAGVVVSPGSAYGPNGEGFFRISLTVRTSASPKRSERMRSSLVSAPARKAAAGPRITSVDRSKRHGRAKQTRYGSRAQESSIRAHASAALRGGAPAGERERRGRRARPSSRSSCAPRAWRSQASWSSAVSTPTPTTTSARASSPS